MQIRRQSVSRKGANSQDYNGIRLFQSTRKEEMRSREQVLAGNVSLNEGIESRSCIEVAKKANRSHLSTLLFLFVTTAYPFVNYVPIHASSRVMSRVSETLRNHFSRRPEILSKFQRFRDKSISCIETAVGAYFGR